MANSKEDNEKEKPDPSLGPLTWGQIERIEQAAEAGDTEAQKQLAEIEKSESYREIKRIAQDGLTALGQTPFMKEWMNQITASVKFPTEAVLSGFTTDHKSLMQKWIDTITDNGRLSISEAINRIAAEEKPAFRGLDELLGHKKTLFQEVVDEFIANKNLLPRFNAASRAILTSNYPFPKDRIIGGLADRPQTSQKPLDQTRGKTLKRTDHPTESQPKIEKVQVVNQAFDILDAATEHCLSNLAPNAGWFERRPLTNGSVAYYWYESKLGYTGKIIIRKIGDKKSEVEVSGPPMPDGKDVIEHYYQAMGWRVDDGSYHIVKEDSFETVQGPELIRLAQKLQQEQRKHLLEVVIPAYFQCLYQADIRSGLEQISLPTSHALATTTEMEKSELPERLQKLDKLSVLWAELNRLGKPKSYNLSQFLQDKQEEVGLAYVGKAEFLKHLPKAYKRGVIDKDKATGRYIPKTGK